MVRRTQFSTTIAIALYLAVAVFNPGFIAVDDYTSNIEMVVPAQDKSYRSVVESSDIRPAFSNLFYFSITRGGNILGLEHPLEQLKLLRIVIAVLALGAFLWSVRLIFESNLDRAIATSVLTLQFLSPLLFTRPMIEATSAPLLLLSAAWGIRYWRNLNRSDLLWALVFLTLSSLFRYQNGLCFLSLWSLPVFRRKWKDIIHLLLLGVLLFVLVGLVDWALKGFFHDSLWKYLNYNIRYSSSYGLVPFYSYLLLFLALTFPPLLFGRYRDFRVAERFGPLIPLFAYFFVFVGVHSLIPHKEERFMIPVLPIFLIMFVPVLSYWWIRSTDRWRIGLIGALNGALLLLTSFNSPQSNVIGVAQFVDENREIHRLVGVQDTLAVFPRAYLSRVIEEFRVESLVVPSCDAVIALRVNLGDLWKSAPAGLKRVARFAPGFLESIVIRLNLVKNARRGAVELWQSTACDNVST